MKEIESVIKNSPTKKNCRSHGFTHEFCETFKEELISLLLILFQKKRRREHFQEEIMEFFCFQSGSVIKNSPARQETQV